MRSISVGLIGVLITIAGLLYTAGEYAPQTFGAPVDTYQKNLIPLTDSTYELGTTTKAWLNLFTDQICLAGDCKTAWPTGGGGSGGGTWSTTTSSVSGTLFNYPNNTSDVVVIGSNSSTTGEFWFDPNTLRSYLSNASTTAFTATTGYFTNLFLNGDTFTEAAQDAIGTAMSAGTTLFYNDGANLYEVINNTSEQKVRAYEEGSLVGSRRSINFLDGTGATLTVADDSGNDRTNVTVAATLGTTVSPTELAVTDFGDFSCNGTICLLDTNVVALATQTTGNYVATLADNGGGTLSISGSGAENAAVTAGINLGNSNAWTALQTFAAATSTNFGISHALSFAGTTGTAWSDFCTAITGGAGLCDGVDNTGGGSGLATSTPIADTYVIYGTSAADVGAEAAFNYDDATNRLTVDFASTTGVTATNFFGSLIGNANTATALAANGANCSAGNSPLGVDASGAAESCFDVWTEAENTAAGYGTGSVTNIATTYPILGGPITTTGTLSLAFGTTTANSWSALQNFSAATSTDLGITHSFSFGGITGTAWTDFCTTITGSAGLCDGSDDGGAGGVDGFDFSYAQSLGYGLTGSATSTRTLFSGGMMASSTSYFSNASTTLSTVLDRLYTEWITDHSGNGVYIASSDDNGYAQITTSNVQLAHGSALLTINQTGSSFSSPTVFEITGSASSTLFSSHYASSTLYYGAGLAACGTNSWLSWAAGVYSCASLDTSGSWSGNAGTATALAANGSNCSAGSFPLGVDASGAAETCTDAWTEAENTAAAYISLGSLSATSPIRYVSGVFSWLGLATTSQPTSSQLLVSNGTTGVYGVSTSSATCSTGVSCSAFTVIGSAPTITSTLGTSVDLTSEITGTLPIANGGTNLTSVGASSTVLTTNGTIMIWQNIATYIAEVMRTVSSIVPTGAWDFGGATSLEIPNGTGPTTDATGELSWDTTSGQMKIYDGSANRVLSNGYQYPAFSYSTSTTWTGTTTIPLGPSFVAETWSQVQCFTDTGTVFVKFHDGTNDMNSLQASTTVGTFNLSTNNTFTAAEKRYVNIGTPASTPTVVSCTVRKSITAD